MAASDLLQDQRRRTGKFIDEHGRRWVTQIDTISFAACAPFVPDGWSAPWLPPDDYLKIDPDDDRRVLIEYKRLIADRRTRRTEYQADLIREATRQFGAASGPMMEAQTLPDGRKIPHPAIIAEVGLSPYSSVFAEAAQSGKSRWVLGQPQANGMPYPMPEWAKPHVWELLGSLVSDGDDEASDIDFSDALPDAFDEGSNASADAAEADRFGDLEEQHDPEGLGGRRQPVRRKPAQV